MRAMFAVIIWFALLGLGVYLGLLAATNRALSIGELAMRQITLSTQRTGRSA
jgi:hypothetical protein